MPDENALAERVTAVERALTDADTLPDLDAADAERVTDLAARVDALERRLDELDGDLQAVRGYVGRIDPPARTRGDRPSAERATDDLPHPVPDVDPEPESERGPSGDASLRDRLSDLL